MEIEQLRRALADEIRSCGQDGPQTPEERMRLGEAYLRLGNALIESGDSDGGRHELLCARDVLGRTISGAKHLSLILQTAFALGSAADARDDLDEASKNYGVALSLAEALNGQHGAVRQIAAKLADVHQRQGDHDSELNCRLKAVAAGRESLKSDDPVLRQLHADAAGTLITTGDHEAAALHLERAIGMSKPDDPHEDWNTAALRAHLARSRLRLGHHADALTTAQQALATFAALGDSEETAKGHRLVGDIYLAMEEWPLALKHHRRALVLVSQRHGEDESVAGLQGKIADSCSRVGRGTEASLHAGRARDIRISSYGEVHPLVALAHRNLAVVLQRSDRQDEALVPAKEALSVSSQVHGDQSEQVGEAHLLLAYLHDDLAHSATALQHARAALSIFERQAGQQSPCTADAHYMTAKQHARLAANDEALPHAMQALEVRIGLMGYEHADVIQAEALVGAIYANGDDHTSALAYLARALHGRMQASANPIETERARRNLAICMKFLSRSMYQQAVAPMTQRAEALLMDAEYGPAHFTTINAYDQAATTMTRLGMYAEAKPYREQVVKMLAGLEDERSGRTVKAKRLLIAVNARLGQMDVAIELLREVVDLRETTPGLEPLDAALEPLGLVCAYWEDGRKGLAAETLTAALDRIEDSTGIGFVDSVDIGAAAIGMASDEVFSWTSS